MTEVSDMCSRAYDRRGDKYIWPRFLYIYIHINMTIEVIIKKVKLKKQREVSGWVGVKKEKKPRNGDSDSGTKGLIGGVTDETTGLIAATDDRDDSVGVWKVVLKHCYPSSRDIDSCLSVAESLGFNFLSTPASSRFKYQRASMYVRTVHMILFIGHRAKPARMYPQKL